MCRILSVDDENTNSRNEIGPEELPSENTEKMKKPYSEVYVELKNSMGMKIRNFEDVMNEYDTFCNMTELHDLTMEDIKKDCFDIASTIYFIYIHDLGGIPDGRLDDLLKNILYADKKEIYEKTKLFLMNIFGKDKSSKYDLITQVIHYIDEHFVEPISVSGIALRFYITPNYLSRLFKKMVGEGCNEYIVRKRIEKAQILLETTNMKTGKIACMVGYRDINYFSMAFKKHTGKSPTKYRDGMRQV